MTLSLYDPTGTTPLLGVIVIGVIVEIILTILYYLVDKYTSDTANQAG